MRKPISQIKIYFRALICVPAFLLTFTLSVARAERLPVKIYTSADGLGSSATFNLVRDSRGFVWICSRDGLVRFDGYRFITYRIGNDDADPAVFSLLPTRSDVYWINLNRGMDYRFIPKSDDTLVEQIQQSPAKNDARIPLLAEPIPAGVPLPGFEDRAGNLWGSSGKGILLLRESEGQWTNELVELILPGNPNKGLTRAAFKNGQEDGSGFWIGTDWGLVRRLPDGKTIHYTINPQNNSDAVVVFAEDKEQRIWIARPEGLVVLKTDTLSELTNLSDSTSRRAVVKQGIFNTDGQAQLPEKADEAAVFSFADILHRDSENISKPDYLKPEINSIICASDGRLWMTSNHGLIVFDGEKFQHYTIEQGLASDLIGSVVEDNDGHIWLSTYGGLHRINPKGLTTFDETDGLERERIHSIYEDRNGDLNVVSGNFNVSRMDGSGAFKMVRPQLPASSIWLWLSNAAFLDSRGDWWVNTQENVYHYTNVNRLEDLDNKPPTTIYNETNGLLSGNNMRVFEDSVGDLWFSTWSTSKRLGLTRRQRSTGQFQHFTTEDGLPERPVASSFAEDAAGNLWFGFTEGGIARYRDGRFTVVNEPNLAKGGVQDIYRDRSGRLWIATNSKGLFRVDAPAAERPAFKRYGIADGLTSDNIRCVVEDLYGNIYVGTVRGVNRLSPETGRVKYYGTSDGLASDFINTAYRDRHGTIWFGTFNGLSKLVPEPDTPSQQPSVLISGLRIAGEDYSVSPVGQREVFVPEQNADRNNLQIDFLSISTGGDASTRYQYRLEGVDANWSEPTSERSVTFANLSPAAYRFLVRAVNADDTVGEQPAFVSFTILRPVWQRWWFLLLAALTMSGAIYALYRYRVKQIINLERVRTRIATDLHDDIGSSLSKIAILSEVVRQKSSANGAEQRNGTNEPLEIIANTSREMVDSMSDIVWAINPERDHLSDLVQRMRHFAEELLDTQDIGYQFIVPEGLKDIALGADFRREIYLIFKETVNNLAKHSGATEAGIAVRLENDALIIEVKDNGRGFEVGQKSNGKQNGFGGNGLRNMKKRAKKCGGDFRVDSEVGGGTRVVLEIPVGKNYFPA